MPFPSPKLHSRIVALRSNIKYVINAQAIPVSSSLAAAASLRRVARHDFA